MIDWKTIAIISTLITIFSFLTGIHTIEKLILYFKLLLKTKKIKFIERNKTIKKTNNKIDRLSLAF
jgi:hypothetical protein